MPRHRPRLLLALLAIPALAGCYLSHERAVPGDAAIADASPGRDAALDARLPDARPPDGGLRACSSIAITATATLDEGVTPRITALPSGELAVVYVRTDGAPTRVVFERLDRALTRSIMPVTITTDSFTWAELALAGPELVIAYGRAGDRASVLQHVSLDGGRVGFAHAVSLPHPSILEADGDAVFWLAFDMSRENTLVAARVDLAGALAHPPVSILLGRYGSGHGAVSRRDGGGHIVTYPREGPRGVRHGYVTAIARDGALGPERLLSEDDGDSAVKPVWHGETLVLVRRAPALVLEPTDPATLERLDRATFPEIDGTPHPGVVGDRLVVAHVSGGAFVVDDFGAERTSFERHPIALPGGTGSPSASVATFPDALVFALTVVEGARSFPWLARVECASE